MFLQFCLIIGIFLAIVDYFLTTYNLGYGSEEVNPIIRYLIHKFGVKKACFIGASFQTIIIIIGYFIGLLLNFDFILVGSMTVQVIAQINNLRVNYLDGNLS